MKIAILIIIGLALIINVFGFFLEKYYKKKIIVANDKNDQKGA